VFTVTAAWADGPESRPLAEIGQVPGTAADGMVTVTGPKLPAAVLTAAAASVSPVKMSASSRTLNPVPDTRTAEPGGPEAGDSRTAAVTANRARLLADPAPVVTWTGTAEDGMAGTTVVILDRGRTVNTAATRPNRTALTRVKPDPVIVTLVPAGPVPGLTDLICGRAITGNALAGQASPARTWTARTASAPLPASPDQPT